MAFRDSQETKLANVAHLSWNWLNRLHWLVSFLQKGHISILLDFYLLYQVRFSSKLEVGNQIWSAATDW